MCHEATSVGLPESIGVGKGTVTLEDFDYCDAVFCIGHNPGTNHPRMLTTLREVSKRGAPIIVFNPLRERGLERFTSPQSPVEMLTLGSTPIASTYYLVKVGGDIAVLTAYPSTSPQSAATQALVNRPSLLILDEPTVGLDPIARDSVWAQVERMQSDFGMTVLLTTHYMQEADALCDRVALMHHGQLQAVGSPAELKQTVSPDATLEDVFRHYAGSDLAEDNSQTGLRAVRSSRRTARRVG